jgi:hypothetical protein
MANFLLSGGIRRSQQYPASRPLDILRDPFPRYRCNAREHRIIRRFRITNAMEADRINLIDNTLQGLAARAAELRRYL